MPLKETGDLMGSVQSKVAAMAFSMAAKIEKGLISQSTKEALALAYPTIKVHSNLKSVQSTAFTFPESISICLNNSFASSSSVNVLFDMLFRIL